MQATIENLLLVYPDLTKSERSKIVRTYCAKTKKSDDTFSRRLKAKEFPSIEKRKLQEILRDLFPNGLPDELEQVA